MSFVWNLKIATKIVGLLALLGIVVMGVAFLGSKTLDQSNIQYKVLTTQVLPSTTQLARLNRLTLTMVYNGYRAITYGGATAEARATVRAEQAAYDDAMQTLAKVDRDLPEIAGDLRTIRSSIDQVHALSRDAIPLGLQNKSDQARVLLAKADVIIDDLVPNSRAINDQVIARADATSARLTAQTESTATSMLAGGAIAVVLAVGGGMIVARVGITGPLNRLKGTMAALAGGDHQVEVPGVDRKDEIGEMAKTVLVFRESAVTQARAVVAKEKADAHQAIIVAELSTNLRRLAEGDLTARIEVEVAADYRDLKTNFNDALTSLGGTIGAVSTGAEAIRTGSAEIAQASEDLARRTEANAASLEQTSAALVQIDGRLKASVVASARTVSRADQAIATVDSGRATAGEAVAAMDRVRDSAKGIDDVIEGLDKIAFQTRVLAMNAAVEAGRAGDAGRGFAVVADLVSALAMRAEEEAKRARDQLTVTQAEVVTAVAAVQKVDGALAAINGDVGEVHALLQGMVADNEAQATGISQITVAVGGMDKSTQQNAAMVEQTSAAARNLTIEVGELSARTAAFNTGTGHTPPQRATRAEPLRPAKPARAIVRSKSPPAAGPRPAVAATYANGHANGQSHGADGDWAEF